MRTCGLAEVVSIVMSMETKSIPYQVAGCLRRRRRYLFEPFCLFQRISSLDDVLARRRVSIPLSVTSRAFVGATQGWSMGVEEVGIH